MIYVRFVAPAGDLESSKAVPCLLFDDYHQSFQSRNEVISQAIGSWAYTMAEIGGHFGMHYMTVSRVVRRLEGT